MRFYRFDLPREAEAAGVRRLCVLLRGLPPEAATWREETRWTDRDELAAMTVELIDGWGRGLAKLLGGKVSGKALQIPRPERSSAAPSSENELDPEALAAWARRNV